MLLQPGDKIGVTRQTRIGEVGHVGIYVGRIYGYAGNWVIECDKESGVRYTLFEDFARGEQVRMVSRKAKTAAEQRTIIARAQQLLGTPYHAVGFNCEHLANYAETGTASSPQLQRYVVGAVASVFFVGMIWNA